MGGPRINNNADQLGYTPAADGSGDYLRLGDLVGFRATPEETERPNVLFTDAVFITNEVIAAEQWNVGQSIYRSAAGVYTTMQTGAFVGVAAFNGAAPSSGIVKAVDQIDGWVFQKQAGGSSADVLHAYDFALTPTEGLIAGGPGLDGRYLLRSYSPDAQIISGWFKHNGSVAPGGATIQLGTVADPDAIMVATDITTLVALGAAFKENPITIVGGGPVPAPEVVMTVTVTDLTAGKFQFFLKNGAF